MNLDQLAIQDYLVLLVSAILIIWSIVAIFIIDRKNSIIKALKIEGESYIDELNGERIRFKTLLNEFLILKKNKERLSIENKELNNIIDRSKAIIKSAKEKIDRIENSEKKITIPKEVPINSKKGKSSPKDPTAHFKSKKSME